MDIKVDNKVVANTNNEVNNEGRTLAHVHTTQLISESADEAIDNKNDLQL